MGNAGKIEEKVFAFIEKHHMFQPGEGVVVGVSGGADSVCLLFVLEAWARREQLNLYVVHVNHGIRLQAREDAAYVRRLCEEKGIPFMLVERNVKELAAARKCSEEEMGRQVRYEAFRQAAREVGAARIAVAHNRNDQAETMLFHLFRGTGLAGLCGIHPVRGGIVRPLLCLERREIEEYLDEKGISYCQDLTNEEDAYARNKIRHHILAYAEEELFGGCVSHMGQTAEQLLEIEEYLTEQTGKACELAVREEEGTGRFRIDCGAFQQLPELLKTRLLLALLQRLSPGGQNISRVHVTAAAELLKRTGNGSLDLPYGILLRKRYGEGFLERRTPWGGTLPGGRSEAEWVSKGQVISFPKEECLSGRREVLLSDGAKLQFSVSPYEKNGNIPKNECTKWFDYDKIKEPLAIRTRNTGDFFSIARGKHQSLKQFMINEKIPAEERDRILLLTEEKHVLWAVGYRISEFYKICEDTELVLQVQFTKGKTCFEPKKPGMLENGGKNG